MPASYDGSRVKRLLKSWKATGSALALIGALALTGAAGLSVSSGDAGVSMPGPEYRLSLVLPAKASPAPAPQEPATSGSKVVGRGQASFYGAGFAGRPTANGERFDPAAMTAAHPSLPFGTKVRVTNQANGRQVVVRINDRGPFAKNRVIDLSEGAAGRIGMINSGTANVVIERV